MSVPMLILYTGGTIGMVAGAGGLQASAGFETQLRAAEQVRQGVGVSWVYQAMEPPIDSANMTQQHWLRMRDAIVHAVTQQACRGVLILHGTDTLAYTAAALSFLLLGLPVPVCVTGAMIPAQQADTDAWDNVFGALQCLCNTRMRGRSVGVFFHGKWHAGTRVSKHSSRSTDSQPVFGTRPSASAPTVQVPSELGYTVQRSPVRLGVLPLYPGIDAAVLQAMLDTGVRGLVLELYGSGTGPADDACFLKTLQQAHQRGVVLVGVSQCLYGVVDAGQYAAGTQLIQSGVLPGGSMTREAALGKLLGLLGAGLSAQAVMQQWLHNLCGEWG